MGKASTGSVFQHKNGLWVAKASVNGKRVFKYAKTQAEAEQLRQQLLTQAAKAVEPAAPKDCFTIFAEQWLKTASLKPATLESYHATLKKYVYPHIGAKPLSDLTPMDIAALISETRSKGASDRLVQYVFAITRRVLEVAFEWEMISRNPAARLKKPKAEAAEKTIWTTEQTQQFLTSQGLDGWSNLFTVLLFTGLRIGELLGLQWSDIDLQRKTLRVQRSLIELDGLRFLLQTPKSKTSIRTIALSEQAIEALLQWELDVAKRNSFIFRRKDNGEPPSRSSLRSAFVAACKRASVPYISIHGLRHVHVSLLAHAGVSVKAAQQRVGHSTPQITLQIYTHVMPEADTQTAAALDALLTKVGK